jgi:DNA-directed DNA polymerase III PolC
MKEKIRSSLLEERVALVDKDFLDYELEFTTEADVERLLFCLEKNLFFKVNERNSLLLFTLGLTDDFDFQQGRSDTIGGAAPDIDMDFSESGRTKLIDHIVNLWGIDNVANIGTHGKFGPRSLTQRYFSIWMPDKELGDKAKDSHLAVRNEILAKIPDPLFGKEPTLKEVVKGNPEKGYPAHPELLEDAKYSEWFDFTYNLDGMISNNGVHPAGMIISDFPVHLVAPTYTTADKLRVTQFDMKEVEALGLIKYDFLIIKTLDVLQVAVELIQKRKGLSIDIYNIPDNDKRTYALFARGLLTGVFQFETSSLIGDAVMKAKPTSVAELSDISALVRPGPMSAGFLDRYLNRESDPEIPAVIADMWSNTRRVLVYQEQLIKLFTEVAGLSLQDADTARRAVGKKDKKYLEKLQPLFFAGCAKYGLSEAQVSRLWDIIIGCADYLFNASHSVAYSYLSYVCAYLKANHTVEYFCALMSVGSRMMSPKMWRVKVMEYIDEARQFDIDVLCPDINESGNHFEIINPTCIRFGLNGIKNVGGSAVSHILKIRGSKPFEDLQDFMNRTNQTKMNTKVFTALVQSGAMDCFGHYREHLLEMMELIFAYKPDLIAYHEREAEILERDKEMAIVLPLIERRDKLRHQKSLKKAAPLTLEEETFLEEHKDLRRKPELKHKEMPHFITFPVRPYNAQLSLKEQLEQGQAIGCYLGKHPAHTIYPEAEFLINARPDDRGIFAGAIVSAKIKTTKKGSRMGLIEIEDGTSFATVLIFAEGVKKLEAKYPNVKLESGMILKVSGLIKSSDSDEDEENQTAEILAREITIYGGKQ